MYFRLYRGRSNIQFEFYDQEEKPLLSLDPKGTNYKKRYAKPKTNQTNGCMNSGSTTTHNLISSPPPSSQQKPPQ